MNPEPLPTCGDRQCSDPRHRADRVLAPIARRLAARAPQTAADTRPAWMRHLTPKDMTGALR